MGPGAVQPHVKAVADEISSRFGITNIGGKATSGHIPGSDHYVGLALDVMTTSKGTLVAEWAIANASRLGLKYVIWNRRYNGLDGKGWVPYTGVSPHTDHVHLSFKANGGDGSSADPGEVGTGSGTSEAEQLKGCLGQLFGI